MKRKHRPEIPLWEKTKSSARRMRKAPTEAENLLWKRVRNRKFQGLKFQRQHPIDRFIVDFCCPEKKLVVELDGEVHLGTHEEDQVRQKYLNSLGFNVIRFSNEQVTHSIDAVLLEIGRTLESLDQSRSSVAAVPTTPPLHANGEGAGG